MKMKLSETECAVMDELKHGAQTTSELSQATERRVTWTTMTRLRDLGVVNLHPRDRTWYLTGAASVPPAAPPSPERASAILATPPAASPEPTVNSNDR